MAEARAAGADAVLLMGAALDKPRLKEMLAVARSRGVDALVEVHDEGETNIAVEAGAELIGVNHRDLRTFEIDIGLTERLRRLIPATVVVVAESGIKDADDARRVYEAGAHALPLRETPMPPEKPELTLPD